MSSWEGGGKAASQIPWVSQAITRALAYYREIILLIKQDSKVQIFFTHLDESPLTSHFIQTRRVWPQLMEGCRDARKCAGKFEEAPSGEDGAPRANHVGGGRLPTMLMGAP